MVAFHEDFFVRKFNLAYVNNPKAGCSTIKKSLLGGGGLNFHDKNNFDSLLEDDRPSYFSVVRNPTDRLLSGYLNKIAGKGKGQDGHWVSIARVLGVDPAVPVSSDRFVNLLADYPDWEKLDPHFRPQVLNQCQVEFSMNLLEN